MGQALDKLAGPSKAEAAAFVSNHSPDPQDLLPGLCLLTERWLEKVSSAPALAAKHLVALCILHFSNAHNIYAQLLPESLATDIVERHMCTGSCLV